MLPIGLPRTRHSREYDTILERNPEGHRHRFPGWSSSPSETSATKRPKPH
jgi:hypothetical protein